MFLDWTRGTVHRGFVIVLIVCLFEDPDLTFLRHFQVKARVRNLSWSETGSECDLKGRNLNNNKKKDDECRWLTGSKCLLHFATQVKDAVHHSSSVPSSSVSALSCSESQWVWSVIRKKNKAQVMRREYNLDGTPDHHTLKVIMAFSSLYKLI